MSLIFNALIASIAAFTNPDFEDSSKYGKVNDHVEIGRFGYNGNGGVRIYPKKRYSYVVPLKDGVRFEKGKRYVFSADVCNFGDSTSQIAVEAYNKKTKKYAHGFWGMGAETAELYVLSALQTRPFLHKVYTLET